MLYCAFNLREIYFFIPYTAVINSSFSIKYRNTPGTIGALFLLFVACLLCFKVYLSGFQSIYVYYILRQLNFGVLLKYHFVNPATYIPQQNCIYLYYLFYCLFFCWLFQKLFSCAVELLTYFNTRIYARL